MYSGGEGGGGVFTRRTGYMAVRGAWPQLTSPTPPVSSFISADLHYRPAGPADFNKDYCLGPGLQIGTWPAASLSDC